MEQDALIQELKSIKDDLNKKQDERMKGLDAAIEKSNEEIKNIGKIHAETKAEIEAKAKAFEETQKRIDALEAKLKRRGFDGNADTKDFNSALNDILQSDEKFKSFKDGQQGKITLELENVSLFEKAEVLTSTAAAGNVIPGMRLPGIIYAPDRAIHVRQFIANGTTTSNKVEYAQEATITDGTAMVAEGALKPQSDFTLELKSANVRKIATHLRLSEEILEDLPALTSYITARFGKKLRLKEDEQILYGDGTGQNLEGIITLATAFDQAFMNGLVGTGKNYFDVLRGAIAQVRQDEYTATQIMMNPADVAAMDLTKDGNGNYILNNIFTGSVTQIKRIPIIESTAIEPGEFLVGDFTLGAQVFDRKQPSIQFYNQDQDNAIKNMVTVVIEERLALAVYRPAVFVTGTFAAATADQV